MKIKRVDIRKKYNRVQVIIVIVISVCVAALASLGLRYAQCAGIDSGIWSVIINVSYWLVLAFIVGYWCFHRVPDYTFVESHGKMSDFSIGVILATLAFAFLFYRLKCNCYDDYRQWIQPVSYLGMFIILACLTIGKIPWCDESKG